MVRGPWSVTQSGGFPSNRARALVAVLIAVATVPQPAGHPPLSDNTATQVLVDASSTPVNNFTASINRLVDLVTLAGSGILSLVWARVAMSWFSNDITKKIQAKDRARDALIGTLLFLAAVTGLLYGLAHWVLTGS